MSKYCFGIDVGEQRLNVRCFLNDGTILINGKSKQIQTMAAREFFQILQMELKQS